MIGALVGHLIGDFVFQNDWMAREKKRSTEVCFTHALIWTICVVACAGWGEHHAAIAILLITHFIQDRWLLVQRWMKFYGQFQQDSETMRIIGPLIIDQVWHIVTIYAIDRWICSRI